MSCDASKVDFIQQQGFTTEGCQDSLYSALMFQPRVIAAAVISGVVLQSPWLFLALSTVLWWSALVPSRNPFDAFFNRVMADPMRLAFMPAAPEPRQFSQAVAGTFALSIAMTLFAGVSPASLAARRRVRRRVAERRRSPTLPPGLRVPPAVAWNSRHALSITVGASVTSGPDPNLIQAGSSSSPTQASEDSTAVRWR